jgi:hypothetical protein
MGEPNPPGDTGPRVRTKHADLSLLDIADGLPGTSEIMASVSRRYANAWYAAHGGNWDLAAYFLRGVRSRQRNLAVIRPKYAQRLADFERDALDPLFGAVKARDLPAFERAFTFGTERANQYHNETGYPYVRWKLPSDPPEDLDLGPGPAGAASGDPGSAAD